MTVKLAILKFSAGFDWVLLHSCECDNEQDALAVVNDYAGRWYRQGLALAAQCGGVWDEDGVTGKEKFKSLRYTPTIEINDGEEVFMAVIDEASQREIYAASQAAWENKTGPFAPAA